MNERVMKDVEPSCFGRELDLGVSRNPLAREERRKKNASGWLRVAVALAFLGLAIYSAYMENTASSMTTSDRWAMAFIAFCVLTIVAAFRDSQRSRRR